MEYALTNRKFTVTDYSEIPMDISHLIDTATDVANFSLDNISHKSGHQAPASLNDCMYQTGLHDGNQRVDEHAGAAMTGFDYVEFKDSLVHAQHDCGLPPAPEPPPVHIPSMANKWEAFFDTLLTPTEANWGEDHDLQAGRANGHYAAGFNEGTGHAALERAYAQKDADNGYIDLGPPTDLDVHSGQHHEPPVNMFDAFIQQHYGAELNNSTPSSPAYSDPAPSNTYSHDSVSSAPSSSASSGSGSGEGTSTGSSASGGSTSTPSSSSGPSGGI
jgi:hypothetical protein